VAALSAVKAVGAGGCVRKVLHADVMATARLRHGTSLAASAQLREGFGRFFRDRGHVQLPSSSLLPEVGDGSLMFVNAGMVQFKDRFLGLEGSGSGSNFSRATTVQKCLRAGGKHNDLDNVGFTPRHHTFFEMLGNFSFGDYFKEEAIVLAWEFVRKELQLPEEKLRLTVHHTDEESERIWSRVAGPNVPIHRLGDEDNFWKMGDGVGLPCGPSSEIFVDTGLEGDDKYLEIWNLVFMQNRSTESGGLELLPRPCVDTGMGLERVAAVLQGVESNFETDLLGPLVEAANTVCREHGGSPLPFCSNVIADHIRACAFLIADGVVPSNTGRGYVLRRIIRRASGFGYRAGIQGPFLAGLLPVLIESFGGAYPELAERQGAIAQVLSSEEEHFAPIVALGFQTIDEQEAKHGCIDAETAFKMQDTFGFPMDLTTAAAAERRLPVDVDGFKALMEEQKLRSAAAASFTSHESWTSDLRVEPTFVGHDSLGVEDATVLSFREMPDGTSLLSISPCPFYAEAGGQIGDRGFVTNRDGQEFEVLDVTRPYKGGIALVLSKASEGCFNIGESVQAKIDLEHRRHCSQHHTATHVLQAALRKVLGPSVVQTGSLVTPSRLRFDFLHNGAISNAQLMQVETLVNQVALQNRPVATEEMTLDEAKTKDAMMLFGEKYDDVVRVVSVGESAEEHEPFVDDALRSVELCGGTHVKRTGELFPFKIVSESSVAAGTRRVEAVVGVAAQQWYEEKVASLQIIAEETGASESDTQGVVQAVRKLSAQETNWKKMVKNLRKELFSRPRDPCVSCDGIRLYQVDDLTPEDAKQTAKSLQELAATVSKNEPDVLHVLVCGKNRIVFSTESASIHAGSTLRACVEMLGGKGGGGAKLAQGLIELDSDEADRLEKIMRAATECITQLERKL